MRVDLRNLVRSQGQVVCAQGAYAKRTKPLALQYLRHRGVRITILSATDDAWSARATHASFPGRELCHLAGAGLSEAGDRADQPGVPVCDSLGASLPEGGAEAARRRELRRRHLRQNRQRCLGGLPPAEIEPDGPVHAGRRLISVEARRREPLAARAVSMDPIAPM